MRPASSWAHDVVDAISSLNRCIIINACVATHTVVEPTEQVA